MAELPYQPISYTASVVLTAFEARRYLEDPNTPVVASLPFKPKGSELFLVQVTEVSKQNDWRSNGHRFYQTKGGKPAIAGNPENLIIRKTHNLINPDNPRPGTTSFQMISWVLQNDASRTLVQFIGDETLSVDAPHGNSKPTETRPARPYVRVSASVIREAEASSTTPAVTYRETTLNASSDKSDQLLRTVANSKQIENARYNLSKQMRVTHDSFVNLMRLDLEYSDVKLLMTVPDLLFLSITPEMEEQMSEILDIDYWVSHHKQVAGWDTQFNLGDFYKSSLTLRDVRFDGPNGCAPVIPTFDLLHERKFQLHHQIAFQMMVSLMPKLAEKMLVSVSDDEFTGVIGDNFKNSVVLKCELHEEGAIDRWVKTHGGSKDDVTVYKADFNTLIRQESYKAYQDLLMREMIPRWSKPFVDYFTSKIHPHIEKFALWKALELGLPVTEKCVISSNQCESINYVNQQCQNWQECPPDICFKIGRDLQRSKVVEMGRGMLGTGNWVMRPEFKKHSMEQKGQDLLRRIGQVKSYQEIVKTHRNNRDLNRFHGSGASKSMSQTSSLVSITEETENDEVFDADDLETQPETTQLEQNMSDYIPLELEKEINTSADSCIKVAHGCYIFPGKVLPVTVNVYQNVCSIDGRMKKGTKCPELNAAAVKEGLPQVVKTKTKSLSTLRANVRADKKKSGRKAPRTYDLIPAKSAGDHDVQETLQEVASKMNPLDEEPLFSPTHTSTQQTQSKLKKRSKSVAWADTVSYEEPPESSQKGEKSKLSSGAEPLTHRKSSVRQVRSNKTSKITLWTRSL